MKLKDFDTLKDPDFLNGAVQEEIRSAIKHKDEFRNIMFIIEKELASYEVSSLLDNQEVSISISGKTAKAICKLMCKTSGII